MSTDPVVRLVALHADNADEAIEILFPNGSPGIEVVRDAIEEAISVLTDQVEDAICRGVDEVILDLNVAELLALELKRRKRRRGHPAKSPRARVLRSATLQYAEDLAGALREEGHRIEEARSLAAAKASSRAAESGDYVAASTLERQMKEAAAARKKKPK